MSDADIIANVGYHPHGTGEFMSDADIIANVGYHPHGTGESLNMELYQAPLEGITGYIYRNTLEKYFPAADKYFAPFITPCEKIVISPRDRKMLEPENNKVPRLIPQILTNSAGGFVELANWLKDNFGYREINLNLGCPSGTVVNKNRGAGALRDTDRLDDFLQEIFGKCRCDISIKTRIGFYSTDEVWELMEIFGKYPYSELIIHPRVREDYYKAIHRDIYFELERRFDADRPAKDGICKCNEAVKKDSFGKYVYNGNIFTGEDYENICKYFTNTKAVMIGRGMVENPGIFREIKGGNEANPEELKEFLGTLLWEYRDWLSGDAQVLQKLKEIWSYMGKYLVEKRKGDERILKSIRKSKSIREYEIYANEFLRDIV